MLRSGCLERIRNGERRSRAKPATTGAPFIPPPSYYDAISASDQLGGFGSNGGPSDVSAVSRTSAAAKAQMEMLQRMSTACPLFEASVNKERSKKRLADIAAAKKSAMPVDEPTPHRQMGGLASYVCGGREPLNQADVSLRNTYDSDYSGLIIVHGGIVVKVVGRVNEMYQHTSDHEPTYSNLLCLPLGNEAEVDAKLKESVVPVPVSTLLGETKYDRKTWTNCPRVTPGMHLSRLIVFPNVPFSGGLWDYAAEKRHFAEKPVRNEIGPAGPQQGEFRPQKYKLLEYVDWQLDNENTTVEVRKQVENEKKRRRVELNGVSEIMASHQSPTLPRGAAGGGSSRGGNKTTYTHHFGSKHKIKKGGSFGNANLPTQRRASMAIGKTESELDRMRIQGNLKFKNAKGEMKNYNPADIKYDKEHGRIA